MRIIIEVDPGASQPVIKTEGAAIHQNEPQTVDGGPPAADLLEALGDVVEGVPSLRGDEKTQPESDNPQNAGAVPDWLVTSVESDQRQRDPRKIG
jgi:hypothetical protein